jgi:acid phosphatase (class A)
MRLVVGLLFSFLLSGPIYAANEIYINAEQLDLVPFLPLPVANGSAEDRAQQMEVMEIQKSASKERIAQANADVEETVFAMYGNILGSKFKAESLPKVTALFEKMGETESVVVDPVKLYFGRKRPYLSNPDIKALVKPSTSGAYPSGHTSRSVMMAIILSKMLPEKQGSIFERADDYAQSRVIGGMHYLSDIEAGRKAGTAIASALLSNSQFIVDFENAKKELRSFLDL